MSSTATSRHHKQLFQIALRSAHSKAELERLIEQHCRHMNPADHAEARASLARRAAELSPNQAKESAA